jgi:plasmid maintenance system antidote protein VapI
MVRVKKKLNVSDLITENHYTQPELAKVMDKSTGYISSRCTGKKPWTFDDALFIADLFGLSDDEMLQYFAHPSAEMKNRRKK